MFLNKTICIVGDYDWAKKLKKTYYSSTWFYVFQFIKFWLNISTVTTSSARKGKAAAGTYICPAFLISLPDHMINL